MCAWVKFLRLLLLNNLSIAFESTILFALTKDLVSMILKYFRPYKHERISLLIGQNVTINNPYFSALQTQNTVSWWYKNLLTDRI